MFRAKNKNANVIDYVFIVNFEHIPHLFVMFLLLNLSK